MEASATAAPPAAPLGNRTVETIRGQHHKFMLIPMIEHHATWFEAGPVSIAVEARALGDSPQRMVRGPSIHVFSAARDEEYIRFDVFGKVLHYHYILNDLQHNVLWGYDPDVNGPMIPWACAALRDRLPVMLRRAGADALASEVEEQGWDTSVLDAVASGQPPPLPRARTIWSGPRKAWTGCTSGNAAIRSSTPWKKANTENLSAKHLPGAGHIPMLRGTTRTGAYGKIARAGRQGWCCREEASASAQQGIR